jgi:hypothetical protein
MQNNVSLCTIVKNSEDTLDTFFGWALDNFSEINIVVDPENDDNTLELCKDWAFLNGQFVNLLIHPFDNFSKQWDRSFEMATKDLILFMGVDEILENLSPDCLEKTLKAFRCDVLAFPRYNLQVDHKNYHLGSYPDYQFRLARKSDAKMDGKPVDETFDLNGKSYMTFDGIHIIHFGHIRSKDWLKMKGKDRLKFASDDSCDGNQLMKHKENWFIERNKQFDKDIFPLREDVIKYIERYWVD